MTIKIPLSKTGKYAGRYVAIVDEVDGDLTSMSWYVKNPNKHTAQYAMNRSVRPNSNGRKTNIYMHREVLERKIGRELQAGEVVDHINGDGLDNRRGNLRVATVSQNSCNQRRQRRNTTSKYKGVAYYKRDNNWESYIKHHGKKYSLGRYKTEVEAYQAYVTKARELFGEFFNDGFNHENP